MFKEHSGVKRIRESASVLQQPLPLDSPPPRLVCVAPLQWASWCSLLLRCLSIRRLTERWAVPALSLNASISLSPFRSHRPRNGGSIRHDPRTHTVLHYSNPTTPFPAPSPQPSSFRSHSLDPPCACAWTHECVWDPGVCVLVSLSSPRTISHD